MKLLDKHIGPLISALNIKLNSKTIQRIGNNLMRYLKVTSIVIIFPNQMIDIILRLVQAKIIQNKYLFIESESKHIFFCTLCFKIDYHFPFVYIINFRFSSNLQHSLSFPMKWLYISTTKLSKVCR